jgi:hypothetical protein
MRTNPELPGFPEELCIELRKLVAFEPKIAKIEPPWTFSFA